MIWVVAATIALAAVVAAAGTWLAFVRRRYVEVTISGSSMEPAHMPGDRILVKRVAPAGLRAGEVVVVQRPARDGTWPAGGEPAWLLKRVAAVPGDPVPRDTVPALASVAEQTVPPGRLVLLGDAGRGSFDSKQIGYFPMSRVLGVVVVRPVRTSVA